VAKRSTTKKPTLEGIYGDVDRAWPCSNCGTAMAVTSLTLTCLKCGYIQKCLLSIEEAGAILKMTLESFPKRLRLDATGRAREELIDVLVLLKAWKALKGLKV